MAGRLWVTSEPGDGSTFQFTARFAPVAAPAATAAPDAVDLHGLRVLVVDDNATNRRLLDEMLFGWRMLPTLAASVPEALIQLRAAQKTGRPFALVLTDVQMPGADGFELVETIRADRAIAGATVIMLTSGGRSGDGARCRALGIAAQLAKPIKRSELRDAIVTALSHRPLDGDGASIAPPPLPRPAPLVARILLVEDSKVNQMWRGG